VMTRTTGMSMTASSAGLCTTSSSRCAACRSGPRLPVSLRAKRSRGSCRANSGGRASCRKSTPGS
jgi:hypothetical protein